MDNLFVGNDKSLTGLTDIQRRTVMSHWIGAGANLILGSDLLKLDELGVSFLTNKVANEITNFTASFPMTPVNTSQDIQLPAQTTLWIAGPDPTTGIAIVLFTNYGPKEGVLSQNITLQQLGLTQPGPYSVENVWHPEQSSEHNGDETITLNVDSSESIFLRLTPAVLPTYMDLNIERSDATPGTLTLPSSLSASTATLQTQSAKPIASPTCRTGKIGTIPASMVTTDGVITPNQLLYRLRQMICNGTCSTPEGVPSDYSTVEIADAAKTTCEISVGVSDSIEAFMHRTTSPTGVEWQECWDATHNIIEVCIKDQANEGWWNGDHVYQFYEGGFRALNSNDSIHVASASSLIPAFLAPNTATSLKSTLPSSTESSANLLLESSVTVQYLGPSASLSTINKIPSTTAPARTPFFSGGGSNSSAGFTTTIVSGSARRIGGLNTSSPVAIFTSDATKNMQLVSYSIKSLIIIALTAVFLL